MSKRKAPKLADADLSLKLKRDEYEKRLKPLQERLSQIQHAYLLQRRSAVIVFEGWDAAGKGGAIRRISAAMDPRSFKVWPIGAPRSIYLDRQYFLRFMERMPPRGAISVFDRSWYGRVLVERVEKLTPPKRWRQAYREINEFERLHLDDGARIVKLFFHVSQNEQLARFEERLRDPMKRWKLSYEDFRNRDNWDAYVEAIDEMFAKTSTAGAPWTLVASENKRHARIAALETIVAALGKGVDLSPPALDDRTYHAANDAFDLAPSLVASLAGRSE